MLKKILFAAVALVILMFFLIPSGASPTDVVLDQQVVLEVPGNFELVDKNHDQKNEELKFNIGIKAFQESQFIVTGNLEAMKDGHWVAIGTTVLPLQWSPEHSRIELTFHASTIREQQLSGPYRVMISLKAGDWELPSQVAGFSPPYQWNIFNESGDITEKNGEISSLAKAERAVETWADYNKIKLGKLTGMDFNYDQWQLDYKERFGKISRFLISPEGSVKVLNIKMHNPTQQ